jgi:hypothetical protein
MELKEAFRVALLEVNVARGNEKSGSIYYFDSF